MIIEYLRSNKNTIIFVFTLAILGIITGIILFSNSDISLKNGIIDKLNELIQNINESRQNNLIFHISIISILILFNIVYIGIPISIFYYYYEFTTIGFLLGTFYFYKKVRGVVFGIILVLTYKALFLIILSYFITFSIKYIKSSFSRRRTSKKQLILNQLYKSIIIIFFISIIDLIILWLGNKFLSIFLFLL